jgi:hypothetical protein
MQRLAAVFGAAHQKKKGGWGGKIKKVVARLGFAPPPSSFIYGPDRPYGAVRLAWSNYK